MCYKFKRGKANKLWLSPPPRLDLKPFVLVVLAASRAGILRVLRAPAPFLPLALRPFLIRRGGRDSLRVQATMQVLRTTIVIVSTIVAPTACCCPNHQHPKSRPEFRIRILLGPSTSTAIACSHCTHRGNKHKAKHRKTSAMVQRNNTGARDTLRQKSVCGKCSRT